jgi:hypothetical protein
VASPDKKAFLLRLPPDVWVQLERLAAAELRSVNGQIEYLLREALGRRMGNAGPSPQSDVAPDPAARSNGPRRGAQKRKP